MTTKYRQPYLLMEDFGAIADGTTDCLAAWNAIQIAMVKQTDSTKNGAVIRFGNVAGNVYYFSQTPKIYWPCIVEGNGGAYGRPRTQLKIAQGYIGLQLLGFNSGVSDATGTIVRNLGLIGLDNSDEWLANHVYTVGQIIQPVGTNANWGWTGYLWKCTVGGTSAGTEPTWNQCNTDSSRVEDVGSGPTKTDGGVTWVGYQVHGVFCEASFCTFEDVYVENFPMDGFHLNGNGFADADTDISRVVRCHSVNCHGDGFYNAGENSNASVIELFDAIANFGYGVNDQAFLANTHIGHHTRSNGYTPFGSSGSYLVGDVTGPELTNGYLYKVTIAGTSGSEPSWPTTIGNTVTSGGVTFKCIRHFSGGPYNQRGNICINLYQEGGQPFATIGSTSICIGGSVDNGTDQSSASGWMVNNRGKVGSFAAISNDDGVNAIQTWVGARNAANWGWSVATTLNGSPILGTEIALAYQASGTDYHGWRFLLDNVANLIIASGDVSGTALGDIQFPTGFWIGGPQAGGSFQSVILSDNAPTGGQVGDEKIRSFVGPGAGRWHNIGTGTPNWVQVDEAAGAPRLDITNGVGSPYQIVSQDHNRIISNQGVTAKAYVRLPDNSAGGYGSTNAWRIILAVQDSHGLRVTAQNPQTITLAGVGTSGPAGFAESTQVGATLMLISINTVEWYALSYTGTWTVT